MTAHSRRRAIEFLLSLLAILTSPRRLLAAAGNCCAQCGQMEGCQKTCRLVCEDKKIITTCWGSKSEDFCVPAPSVRGNRNCELVCDDGDDADDVCRPERRAPGGWLRSLGDCPS